MDEEIIISLLLVVLRSKSRGLTKKLLPRAKAIFQIEPMDIRIRREDKNVIRKLKKVSRIAQVKNNTKKWEEGEGKN